MKEITIKYWGHHGRQEERKFQCGDRKIDMIMRTAQRVDLSEVRKCTELEVLNLGNNQIEELDLTPLRDSQTIKTLLLEDNRLTKLDLWPLSNCSSFKTLVLKNNPLPGLDLTPVFLRVHVDLDSSVVISADYMLRYCLSNDQLKQRFRLFRPDNTSWTATPVIIWNKYDTLANTYKWSEIHDRIHNILEHVEPENWFAIQRGLLIGFSLEELAGYDGNPRNILSSTTPDMDYKTAREVIFGRTIDLIDEQIESGGSTLFLETEPMKTTRASKLIPKIIEARNQEMEKAIVYTKGSVALMNSLWLTYYGSKILRALDVGFQHYGDGLNRMRKSLDDLGFELYTEEVPSLVGVTINDPIRASNSLKNHVFDLVIGAFSAQPPTLPSSQA